MSVTLLALETSDVEIDSRPTAAAATDDAADAADAYARRKLDTAGGIHVEQRRVTLVTARAAKQACACAQGRFSAE